MSEVDVSVEERNAYVGYKREQNERKAQHHDEGSQNLRVSKLNTLLLVVFAIVGLSIYAFEKLDDKPDEASRRERDWHFYKTVSFELAANEEFSSSLSQLCDVFKSESHRSEYAKMAHEMGAVMTAHWLAAYDCDDCETLVDKH